MAADLHGKTCVITGATSGIGRSTARALAAAGARVGIVARDRQRAEETVAEIRAATGNSALDVFLADLAVQAEVRRVAGEILARYSQLHVLINNAGVVNLSYSTTPDGIETVFAVNHLAYFLLTNLLLERLRASAPARIVNVASDAHKFARQIDFDDLGHQATYSARTSMQIYGHSKLANILFTYELARRLAGSGVTVNCVHPGAVATRLGQNNGRVATLLTKLLAPFFRSPERGAATSVWLATAPELAEVTGKYFMNCREGRSSRYSHDLGGAQRLWDVSARLVGM